MRKVIRPDVRLAIFCAVFLLFGGVSFCIAQSRKLEGHRPTAINKLEPLEHLSGSNRLAITIGLPLRNSTELGGFLADLYNPASSRFNHYLTPDEFTARFAPSEKDYQAVIDFARAAGLSIKKTHSNRTLVLVSGTVAEIEKIFKLNILVYSHPQESRKFYAPDQEPSVPTDLSVLHIGGLDNFQLPHPLFVLKDLSPRSGSEPVSYSGSGTNGTYLGNDFRPAYVPNVSLQGSGQAVGLVEFDGYYPNDILRYETLSSLPPVPVTPVLLDGFNGLPTNSNFNVEVSLDIEMIMAMAPGLSNILVYEEEPTIGDANNMLNRMATDNLAKQLSCSWGFPINASTEQIFEQFAAQGQSFFQASGDSDAWVGPVYPPSDDPYVTVVGGTTLQTSGPGGSWVSETVWNRGDGIGSGGGVSTKYTIPAWQNGVDMSSIGGSVMMRNIPDVAMTADNIFVVANSNQYFGVIGTSCAAPLWAGFAALANEQAATNNQPPIGFINPALYTIGVGINYSSCFNDITQGNNTNGSSPNSFFASRGYDLCTGWGTIAGQALIDALTGAATPTPPSIVGQPQSQSVPTASTVVLAVTATGSLPMSYLWSFNGAYIDSATNAWLTLGNIQGSQSGTYWVLVTNLYGTIQSSNAVVTVEPPIAPTITGQPQDQTVPVGGVPLFHVSAIGTPPLNYQWRHNGSDIPGATSAALRLLNAQLADAGNYSVLVSNMAGMALSSNASLTLLPPSTNCYPAPAGLVGWWPAEGNGNDAASTNHGTLNGAMLFSIGEKGEAFNFNGANAYVRVPASSNLDVGSGDGLTVETWINPTDVSQIQPLVDWSKVLVPNNGAGLYLSVPMSIGGKGPGSLAFTIKDGALREHLASTDAGFITSNLWQHVAVTYNQTDGAVLLYVNGTLLNETNFAGLTPGSALDLWVGFNPVPKNWYPPVLGAESRYNGLMDELAIYNRALTPQEILGIYRASTLAKCPFPPSAATIQPTNETVAAGNPAMFTGVANGTPPLYYQWSFNGTSLPGATNSTLQFPHAQFTDAGSYAMQASNVSGVTISMPALLTVITQTPPSITSQPTNLTVAVSNSATFRILVMGTAPLSYQWSFNGTNLVGQTSSSMTLSNVHYTEAGRYVAQVSNLAGVVISTNASLTISPPWIPTGGLERWCSIASSADGIKLVAAAYSNSIFVSTDAGATWIRTSAVSNTWQCVCSSADGVNLAAAAFSGHIYFSTNAGIDWASAASPLVGWGAMAGSADGSRLIASVGLTSGIGIYASTNFGASWKQTSAPSYSWAGLASSADGMRLAAAAIDGHVAYSTNAGLTWLNATVPTVAWSSVAASADGMKFAAAAGGFSGSIGIVSHIGPIFTSTNAGATWTSNANAPILSWKSIACSADGTKLAAAAGVAPGDNGQIYISTDCGVTWRNTGAPSKWWFSIASSADGTRLAAATAGTIGADRIYAWHAGPTLGISHKEGQLLLSWDYSWNGFVLEQNADLKNANWTTVTRLAAFTNGENEVRLTPFDAQTFFRLRSP